MNLPALLRGLGACCRGAGASSAWSNPRAPLVRGLGGHILKIDKSAKNTKALRPGAEQLTVEAAVGHLELLEIRQRAPFRRDSASELVTSVLPPIQSSIFTAAKIEHLE